jgi:hypothetical protein
MQAAPLAAASFIDIFSACLVTGFNTLTFTSLTVTNGIARAVRTNGHGFLFDQIVNVSGASPSSLNGNKRVLSSMPSYIEFDAQGVADGTATGTIVIMTAPAGWSAPYQNANVIALRNADANSPYYRLDNIGGSAGVRPFQAYASMSDIDTGTGKWGDRFLAEPSTGSPIATWGSGAWLVIADSLTAWAFWPSNSGGCLLACGFGKFSSFVPNDPHDDFIQGSSSAHKIGGGLFSGVMTDGATNALAGSAVGNTGVNICGGYGLKVLNDASGYYGSAFPSPVDNGLLLVDSLFRETTDGAMRGRNRGVYWCTQDRPGTASCPGQTLTGVSGLEGRTIMLVGYHPVIGSIPAIVARVAMDITGPWG